MAHLFDSQKTQREEKTSGKREKKGRKEGSHTLPSTSFISFSVRENKEGEDWERERGRTKTGKEEKGRRDVRRKR